MAFRFFKLLLANAVVQCAGMQLTIRSMIDASHKDCPLGEKDKIIIVRLQSPVEAGMIARLEQVASDVRENLTSTHFVFSVDETKAESSSLDDAFQSNVGLSGISIHRYTSDSVKAVYPAVGGPGDEYTVEPILLALDFVKEKVPVAENGAQVWVFDDEIFACGGLSSFLTQYAHDASDLLGRPLRQAKSTVSWDVQDGVSERFLEQYMEPDWYSTWDRVRRYSTKFLDHMKYLCRDVEMSAVGAMFAPTVCINDGFKCGNFNSKRVDPSSSGRRATRPVSPNQALRTEPTPTSAWKRWKSWKGTPDPSMIPVSRQLK